MGLGINRVIRLRIGRGWGYSHISRENRQEQGFLDEVVVEGRQVIALAVRQTKRIVLKAGTERGPSPLPEEARHASL